MGGEGSVVSGWARSEEGGRRAGAGRIVSIGQGRVEKGYVGFLSLRKVVYSDQQTPPTRPHREWAAPPDPPAGLVLPRNSIHCGRYHSGLRGDAPFDPRRFAFRGTASGPHRPAARTVSLQAGQRRDPESPVGSCPSSFPSADRAPPLSLSCGRSRCRCALPLARKPARARSRDSGGAGVRRCAECRGARSVPCGAQGERRHFGVQPPSALLSRGRTVVAALCRLPPPRPAAGAASAGEAATRRPVSAGGRDGEAGERGRGLDRAARVPQRKMPAPLLLRGAARTTPLPPESCSRCPPPRPPSRAPALPTPSSPVPRSSATRVRSLRRSGWRWAAGGGRVPVSRLP